MKQLKCNNLVIANVVEARSIFSRSRGLMFRSHWDKDTTLWIHRCNSIHTFFVNFPIDVVFVDKNLIVKKVLIGLKPWQMVLPILSATSVFEFASGNQMVDHLNPGDQLHVGD